MADTPQETGSLAAEEWQEIGKTKPVSDGKAALPGAPDRAKPKELTGRFAVPARSIPLPPSLDEEILARLKKKGLNDDDAWRLIRTVNERDRVRLDRYHRPRLFIGATLGAAVVAFAFVALLQGKADIAEKIVLAVVTFLSGFGLGKTSKSESL